LFVDSASIYRHQTKFGSDKEAIRQNKKSHCNEAKYGADEQRLAF